MPQDKKIVKRSKKCPPKYENLVATFIRNVNSVTATPRTPCTVPPTPAKPLADHRSSHGSAQNLPPDTSSSGVRRTPPSSLNHENEELGEEIRNREQCEDHASKTLPTQKALQPSSFYGSNAKRMDAVHSMIVHFLANVARSVASKSTKGGSGADRLWRTFPRQEFAFRAADSQGAELEHVAYFSYEEVGTGRRRFLISSYTEFWRRYLRMRAEDRHYYEILREGLPCHLYYDVEYLYSANPDVDGELGIASLLALTAQALQAQHSVSFEPEDVVELDSSTEAKFSRHLILHLPGAAFSDSVECGLFVRGVLEKAEDEWLADPRLASLMVWKEGEGPFAHANVDEAAPAKTQTFPGRTDTPGQVVEELPDMAETLTEESEIMPEESEIMPEESEILPEETEMLPEETECTLLEETETLPEDTERLPEMTEMLGEVAAPSLEGTGPFYGPTRTLAEETEVPGPSKSTPAQNERRALMVDLGVYTRNRAFRLYLSRKFGKKASLIPMPTRPPGPWGWEGRHDTQHDDARDAETGTGTARPGHSGVTSMRPSAASALKETASTHTPSQSLFLRSLVCNVPVTARLLGQAPDDPNRRRGFNSARSGRNVIRGGPGSAGEHGRGGGESEAGVQHGYGPCARYPLTQTFVEQIGSQHGGGPGAAKSWVIFEGHQVVLFNMSGNRFCYNVDRCHKSNSVMYIVDFNAAVYYQKCHDPDCRHYRSCTWPMPTDICAREGVARESHCNEVNNQSNELEDEYGAQDGQGAVAAVDGQRTRFEDDLQKDDMWWEQLPPDWDANLP
ncbi:hypothetical protein CYMTET_51584 [Cymbomonas tetramitiformis]|uniref:DNA-directed primase/polymerase protein n=1 Tax=Cymbomonas tetramitiformis TaxID=36881 RepID=A0AAE0BM84_9CHLO|nr:hypothetical protein CYMTET_51584 [Cymbomonas tetramitiformis]